MIKEIHVEELRKKILAQKVCLLDVREAHELKEMKIHESFDLPLSELVKGYQEGTLPFAKGVPVYVICRSGSRSKTG